VSVARIASDFALEDRFRDGYSLSFSRRLLPKVAQVAHKRGLLRMEEELEAFAPVSKMSPWYQWAFFPLSAPLTLLLFERNAWLLVTPDHVIVTGWRYGGGVVSGAKIFRWPQREVLRLGRPVRLTLTKALKHRRWFTRNSVELPDEIAAALGRRTVYVAQDLIAADAFRLAATPGADGRGGGAGGSAPRSR
jgi:hypothetical protein